MPILALPFAMFFSFLFGIGCAAIIRCNKSDKGGD